MLLFYHLFLDNAVTGYMLQIQPLQHTFKKETNFNCALNKKKVKYRGISFRIKGKLTKDR